VIDYITFILDDQHFVAGCTFYSQFALSPNLFQFASEALPFQISLGAPTGT
jgi:hypothetical protein